MNATPVPYVALALQTACHTVNRCAESASARAAMLASLERVARQIAASRAFIGPALRLVVLPEYFLTGYPLGESLPGWAEKAALAPDGAEYRRMGEIARELGLYISGNAYETDPHFPGIYFQASFIFDDQGRPVAFGGRKLPDAEGPKYQNSRENALYNKSATLYGLNWAKNDIVHAGEVVGEPGNEVRTFVCATEAEQAQLIAEELRRAHLDEGFRHADIAVLVRSGRRQIAPIARALVAAGIPVEVAGDEIPLLSEQAVRPLLLALEVVLRGTEPGGNELDASLLLLAEFGFIDPRDPRYVATVTAIGTELKRGDFIFRYVEKDDFGEPENAFLVCSFWYVNALCALDRREEARALFERLLSLRNRHGLLAEHVHPGNGEQWGNFVQTYSMVGLVNSATRLSIRWDQAF